MNNFSKIALASLALLVSSVSAYAYCRTCPNQGYQSQGYQGQGYYNQGQGYYGPQSQGYYDQGQSSYAPSYAPSYNQSYRQDVQYYDQNPNFNRVDQRQIQYRDSNRPMNQGSNRDGVYTRWETSAPDQRDSQYNKPNKPYTYSENAQNPGSMQTTVNTDDVAYKVRRAVQNDNSLSTSARNIQISVDGGRVTLTGTVDNDAEKNKVESIVKRVDGVRTVSNKLEISNR